MTTGPWPRRDPPCHSHAEKGTSRWPPPGLWSQGGSHPRGVERPGSREGVRQALDCEDVWAQLLVASGSPAVAGQRVALRGVGHSSPRLTAIFSSSQDPGPSPVRSLGSGKSSPRGPSGR